MTPEEEPEKSTTTFEAKPLETYQAYIRMLQKLKNTDPFSYERIPEILKTYTPEEIDRLTDYDTEALKAVKALPEIASNLVSEEAIKKAQAYLRLIQKLKNNELEYEQFPSVLRNISEEEIENLDADYLLALQLMNVFPGSSPTSGTTPEEKQKTTPHAHPSHQPYATNTPPIEMPNYGETAAKIANLYIQGAQSIMNSITESNEKMGEAFKRIG